MQYIEKAIQLKKELDALRPLTQDDEARIMQKFRLDWNYHSNHLEGNSLTYGETKALILFGLTAQGKPLKDHFEITGHDDAVKWISEIVKQERPLSENFIRELHTLILKESYETDAITPEGLPTKKRIKVGEYKTTPNHVKTKTGEIFRFATPEETPAKMHDLIEWYREKTEEKDLNPILLAVEFHYKYIRIHPFDDGNGRTARLLMNFILMQYGYPPVIIKTDDKENYFAALRQADAGILEPFVQYITENLNHSLELMIRGAKGESIEEPNDLEKEIALLRESFKTINAPLAPFKNLKHIYKFYDESVSKLYNNFIEKGYLFVDFYLESKGYLVVKERGMSGYPMNTILDESRKLITKDTEEIELEYSYESLNHEGFRGENYLACIKIFFRRDKIYICDIDDYEIMSINYGEQLSGNEIEEVIRLETKKHKEAIEKNIKKLNGKKTQ